MMRYPLPRGPEFIHNSRATLFFVSVGVVHMPWCASGSQRIALWGPFSPFIFIWVPGFSRCQAFPASIFTCREVMELNPGEYSFPVLIGLENPGFPCRRALCPHHLSLSCVLYGVCGHHARRAGFLPVLPRGATSLFIQLAIYTFTDCPQLCS